MKTILAIDFDKHAADTYRADLGSQLVVLRRQNT